MSVLKNYTASFPFEWDGRKFSLVYLNETNVFAGILELDEHDRFIRGGGLYSEEDFIPNECARHGLGLLLEAVQKVQSA